MRKTKEPRIPDITIDKGQANGTGLAIGTLYNVELHSDMQMSKINTDPNNLSSIMYPCY